MPSPDASKQKWEACFDQLSSMINHYDIAAKVIIYTVTGHLHSSNPVVHGWTEQLTNCADLAGCDVELNTA
jgi:hypothetical protein